jgi:xanthosine utilization system XapX-like protein
MISTRIPALAVTATIGLTGALASTALAGSHWSSAKCSKTYLAWYKKHIDPNGSVSAKQAKEQTAYIRKLEHQHHCHFSG